MYSSNDAAYIYDYYNKYKTGTSPVSIDYNGEMYDFEFGLPDITTGPNYSSDGRNINAKMMVDQYNSIDENEEEYSKMDFYFNYFEQRPDIKILYEDLNKLLAENKPKKAFLEKKLTIIETYMPKNLKKYSKEHDELIKELEKSSEIIDFCNEKLDSIISDIYEYNNLLISLHYAENKLGKYPEIEDKPYAEMFASASSVSDKIYYSQLAQTQSEVNKIKEEIETIKSGMASYQTAAITLDDIKYHLKGYNSSCGNVPAGEWDTWKNPKYEGSGYVTGLIGSFEGPSGKETGYDSRKGAEKSNYKDPDRALLKLLAQVTDKDGNYLYPMSSFRKGGEYYYHIFGVNDDGSINWNLIDNPRFGCKMLGNYLIVGGDQRLKRNRGSKVMTSLGPAIAFDCGDIDDLVEDPGHIDISMDEVLFWLRDFSHNQDLYIETVSGIYDWCTTDSYKGIIDESYEIMERNYVNNLNVTYDANLICVFDREDFVDETNFENQNDFVYQLTYKR